MYHCDGCGKLKDEDFDAPEEIEGRFYCEECVCNSVHEEYECVNP